MNLADTFTCSPPKPRCSNCGIAMANGHANGVSCALRPVKQLSKVHALVDRMYSWRGYDCLREPEKHGDGRADYRKRRPAST
jgi:hypothetical protein